MHRCRQQGGGRRGRDVKQQRIFLQLSHSKNDENILLTFYETSFVNSDNGE